MSDPRRVMKQLTALTARLPREPQPSRPTFTAQGTDEQLSTAVAVYPQIDMSGSSTVSITNDDRTHRRRASVSVRRSLLRRKARHIRAAKRRSSPRKRLILVGLQVHEMNCYGGDAPASSVPKSRPHHRNDEACSACANPSPASASSRSLLQRISRPRVMAVLSVSGNLCPYEICQGTLAHAGARVGDDRKETVRFHDAQHLGQQCLLPALHPDRAVGLDEVCEAVLEVLVRGPIQQVAD